MIVNNYPVPQPNADTKYFWDGCQQDELRYKRCSKCGHAQCMPRSLCERCQSTDLEWNVSQRTGRVLTFTTVHRAPLPVFKKMVPYVIAIVDMDEGFRVMANALPAVQQDPALEIGARVRIGFKEIQGMALPVLESLEVAK